MTGEIEESIRQMWPEKYINEHELASFKTSYCVEVTITKEILRSGTKYYAVLRYDSYGGMFSSLNIIDIPINSFDQLMFLINGLEAK